MRFVYTDGSSLDFMELCHELDDFLNELVGGEYSCAGVPLLRRNGYRQSGARKPLFQNRDTAPNCLLPASLLA